MLKATADYLASLPSVFVDGLLYVLIALLGFLLVAFSTDDAAKYMPAYVLFWVKMGIGASNAVVAALKMYRSTQFSDHQAEKKRNGHTQFLNRSDTGP